MLKEPRAADQLVAASCFVETRRSSRVRRGAARELCLGTQFFQIKATGVRGGLDKKTKQNQQHPKQTKNETFHFKLVLSQLSRQRVEKKVRSGCILTAVNAYLFCCQFGTKQTNKLANCRSFFSLSLSNNDPPWAADQ